VRELTEEEKIFRNLMSGAQNPDERNGEKIWKGNLTIFMRNPLNKESA